MATENRPQPSIVKNDRLARILIAVVSIVIFAAVVLLGRVKISANPGFDIHVFAFINAVINSFVSLLLIAGLIAVKRRNYVLHKKIMLSAILLSVLFLLSYICHHLFAGETRFGDVDRDGIVTAAEKAADVLLYNFRHAYSPGRDHSSFYFIYGLPRTHRGISPA